MASASASVEYFACKCFVRVRSFIIHIQSWLAPFFRESNERLGLDRKNEHHIAHCVYSKPDENNISTHEKYNFDTFPDFRCAIFLFVFLKFTEWLINLCNDQSKQYQFETDFEIFFVVSLENNKWASCQSTNMSQDRMRSQTQKTTLHFD